MSRLTESGGQGFVPLPKGWRMTRVKRICCMHSGDHIAGDEICEEGEFPVYGGNDLRGYYPKYNCEGPMLIVGRQGALCGNVHRIDGKFWATEHALITTITHFDNLDYLYYLFTDLNFNQYVSQSAAQPGLAASKIIQVETVLPPRPEQERIAAFLDEKCATVDKAIEVKRKQLESIAGQRKSLITQSVVFGLGACRSRKTGIEWMPLVNSDWEVVSLKRLLSRKMEYGLSEAAELEDENLPRYIRITDFGDDGELKDDTFRSLPVEIAREAMLQANDVLFARSGATVGKSYIYTGWRTGACFAGYLIRAQTKTWRLNPKFLYYFTKSAAYDAWKGLIFTQATIQNISAVKYGQLKMPVPPVQTQNEIVSYLELKERKFDALAANLRKQIETLAQYRKSLIHEYVTGMRRVVS